MAIMQTSFFPEVTDRWGDIIFYRVEKQIRIRRCPEKVKNVNSEAQQLQRNRMRTVMAFYRTNGETVLPVIWKEMARELVMSGYNLFVKKNIAVFDQNHKITDYKALYISDGYLELPLKLRVSGSAEGRIEIRWKNLLPVISGRDNDHLMIAWLPDNGSFTLRMICDSNFCRQNESAEFYLPELKYENLHIYCFFAATDRKRFSPMLIFI